MSERERPPYASSLDGMPARRDAGWLVRHRRHADRARNAGAAETTIALRVLGEILLVVVLGEVERRTVHDLRGDGAVTLGLQLLLIHRPGALGDLSLACVSDVDARPVLRADVVPLAHALGRVVRLEERLDQRRVANLLRVID